MFGGGIIRIGILGYDILDFSVYLSMILKNLQYDVIVADMTHMENQLFNWQESCENSYKKIIFHKGKSTDDYFGSFERERDIVIFLFDDEKDNMLLEMDKTFIITDNRYQSVMNMRNMVRSCEQLNGIIFRDITENGVNANYIIKQVLKDDYLVNLQKSGKVYEINDDIYDREYNISLQYDGITDFKHLSDKFIKSLHFVAREITAFESKLIEKAILKAKDGEIYEHCILE